MYHFENIILYLGIFEASVTLMPEDGIISFIFTSETTYTMLNDLFYLKNRLIDKFKEYVKGVTFN